MYRRVGLTSSLVLSLSSVVVPKKISLVIVFSIVALLLAPYAGCNRGSLQTHSDSDTTSPDFEEHERAHRKSSHSERGSSAGAHEPLDQIEDLLAK